MDITPRTATRLLVMSFEGQLSPVFDVRCLNPDAPPADGWGLGYYGADEASVRLVKEARPPQVPGRSRLMQAQAFEAASSSIFVFHIREARWGAESLANTQPFMRIWCGREWLFAHCGSMNYPIEFGTQGLFEPIGSTDSELIFCELMSRIAGRKWRNLGYVDFQLMRDWFAEFNAHGTMNSVVTDGRDVCVYSDAEEPLYVWELKPPHGQLVFGDDDVDVDLTSRGVKSRKGLVFCSRPLTARRDTPLHMRQIPPGTLTVVREGHIRYEIGPNLSEESDKTKTIVVRPRKHARPRAAEEKLLEVSHRTVYRYAAPVEHSTHLLRLSPIHDRLQHVLYHRIHTSVSGREREYEDVFGNFVRRLLVQAPFKEMVIEARSIVQVSDTDPLRFRPLHARTTLPLVWMPWQHHMLAPYLLPPELPESQLLDLADYAMSFARRNDHDLIETLIDVNSTIFREYTYIQGSTTILTTAYEVFQRRRGVCQDFTNLFICMARLLGVPARYVCGYIYTGPKNLNQTQSEASHAWAQVYLPEVGWTGFDPTNGCLTQTDHIRVAVGRNYVDATPTSGTIYVGGGGETLSVDVWVEPVREERVQELMGELERRRTPVRLEAAPREEDDPASGGSAA